MSVSFQEPDQATQISKEKFGPEALAVEELGAGGSKAAKVGQGRQDTDITICYR